MPTPTTLNCQKEFIEWVKNKYALDQHSLWDRKVSMRRPHKTADWAEWSYRVLSQYDSPRRMLRVFRWHSRARAESDTVERLFHQQVDRWKAETGHLSSVTKMIAHPSYLRIIGLANRSAQREIEQLLIRELQKEPDHWFAALTAITGEDPVQPHHDFDEAVAAWVEWGRLKGII